MSHTEDPHHTKEFFEQMRSCRDNYRKLGDCIHEVVGPAVAALDIGCGIGLQTRRLYELGWSIIGAEYTPCAIEMREPGVMIESFDLTKPLSEQKEAEIWELCGWGCVICTETAEHIPAEFADQIVQNVTDLARHTIVWSAASPGQEWPGHINLQDPAYWLRRFLARGWVPDHRKTDQLRRLMVNRQAQHWMGSHNFFVLVRAGDMPHFTIVSTILNGQSVIGRCIESVRSQTCESYTHIVVDADSTDHTTGVVSTYLDKYPPREIFISGTLETISELRLLTNSIRKPALQNLWEVAQTLPASEVIVWLDGDDWLAHDRALEELFKAYLDPSVWMTFGQFMFPNGEVGFASPYPDGVNVRHDAWRATHLKTFRAGLLKKMKLSDLQHADGSFVELAIDRAVMYPLLELAGTHWRCMYQVLSVYNLDAAWHVSATQEERAKELAEVERLQALPSYAPLEERPW